MNPPRRSAGPLPAAPAAADERTLAILDFPAVLQALAGFCAGPLGRELALGLRPEGAARRVREGLAETAEALQLSAAGTPIPCDGCHDVRETLARARRGAVLGPADLWAVGETAGAIRRLRAFFRQEGAAAPLLAGWAEDLGDLDAVEREVRRCLSPDGEVLDGASPALAEARRAARRLEAALREHLEGLLRDPALQGALQEALITQRHGRFVLPVRSDQRALVPGLVHDQSGSGATVFVEPLGAVERGNALRAAQAAVEHEVASILRALSELCGRDADAWDRSLAAAAHLDLCAAKARLAAAWSATAPTLLPEPGIRLVGARHPLLPRAVPIDLRCGLEFDALVLTGPNTGGKTVTLKIAGLFAAMAQSGLHLPAAEAEVGVFPRICGDAGDEQGVAQNLSTFSSHMRAVVAAVRAVVPGALVLLDELGAGTDPSEGAALGMALLEHLLAAGARILVTTHSSELKAFAYRTPRVENGSMSFDPETLAPTYRLELGAPGESRAFAIAARLGLPPAIVDRARALQRPEERHLEEMIAGMRAASREAEEQRAAAGALRAALEEERRALEERREAVLAAAREEAAEILARAREEADAALRALRRLEAEARAGAAGARAGEEHRARLRRAAEELAGRQGAPRFHAGQPVRIRSMDREGIVVGTPEAGSVLVQAGRVRLHVPPEDLAPAPPPAPAAGPRPPAPALAGLAGLLRHVPLECDLRGLDRLDALARVDKALDDAVLAGLREIRLIHGKGTGALREAVGEFLRGHPQVASFRLGGGGEGGAGATVVEIRG
jgi:DNA mismatch repair protein MutS2